MSHAQSKHRPEWAPKDAGEAFASEVKAGISNPGSFNPQARRRRRGLGLADYVAGIEAGDRAVLAQAITLVESNAPAHLEQAQAVLQALMPRTGQSVRVGITGVPGVGKSTFIEAFGRHLCESGHQVAVLAVDPSSSVSGGSVLGDKTRMELLAREPKAFIRPSPSGGTLGGVTRKSRETLLLCEAAGYDVILVETVGVGQSEVAVRSMVDFFLLLMIAGAGDELQGLKKGIMELGDALFVNKSDGDNRQRAENTRGELARVLHYLTPFTRGWKPKVLSGSALNGGGIPEVWQLIEKFVAATQASGVFAERRQRQSIDWLHALIEDWLKSRFYSEERVRTTLPALEARIAAGELNPTAALGELVQTFEAENR
ncbi:MAG: methylmalonyl Co-A mutase-associated GTPase MeaB [Opitutales bacterium]